MHVIAHRTLRVFVLVGLLILLGGNFSQPKALETSSDYQLGRMEAFSWVLLQLKQDYVDPSRIYPQAMMKKALEYVEQRVPEVEIKLKNGQVVVQAGGTEKAFTVGQPKTVWEMNYNLHPVFEFIAAHLETTADPKDVEFAAINGMLSTLDPHSNLLPPELFREMQLKTVGEFGGLGIKIGIRKGQLTVMSPLPDTPASRLGLKAGDEIVQINDHSTVNMPVDEAVNLLRGEPGSKVTIWVKRTGWSEPHKYVIARETIRVKSIDSHLLDQNIGYIQIQDFGKYTGTDLRGHLSDLKLKAKRLRGLVLDLRNNAGGLLKTAVSAADLFLDHGTIVATVAYSDESTATEKIQKSREEKRASGDDSDTDLPIVVLTNSGSASASEILAGALKNLDRAVVIGDRSFGKGSVQILNDRLPPSVEGACLKLTVAEYLIPGDVSIQEIGVTPDIQLEPMLLDPENLMAFAEQNPFREEDIPLHLKKHSAERLKPTYTLRYLAPVEKKRDRDEEPIVEEPAFTEDFEIKLAKRFLLSTQSATASAQLNEAKAFVEQERHAQEQEMIKALKDMGIDWQAGQGDGAQGKASFALTGTGAKGSLAQADQSIEFSLSVTNTGGSPYLQLRAESDSKNGLFDKREFLFGKLDPGQTLTRKVPIKIPRGALSRTDDVRLTFNALAGKTPEPLVTQVTLQELPRPAFGFSVQVLDDEGNKNGILEPGEEGGLQLTVTNLGSGKAYTTKAAIKNEAGADLFLKTGKGRVEFGEIALNQTKRDTFRFTVAKELSKDNLPVTLTVWDADLNVSQELKIDLPVFRGAQPTRLEKGYKVVAGDARLRNGPRDHAAAVGLLPQGSLLASSSKLGEYVRVDLPAKGKNGFSWSGWVALAGLKESGAPKKVPVELRLERTPPVFALASALEGFVPQENLALSLIVEDADHDLRDVAIWVNEDKVFLKSGNPDNGRKLDVAANLKLRPGPNYLVLVAREGLLYSSQKTLVLSRLGGLDFKEDEGQSQPQGSDLILE